MMMQKVLLYLTVMAISLNIAFSQGTAINSTGNAADSSAMLDVSSAKKGVLFPRMNTAQVNAIVSPAVGLLIYNTDINCFQYWDGSSWLNDCGSSTPGSPVTSPCITKGGTASASITTGSCGYSSVLSLVGSLGNIQWQQSSDGNYFYDVPGAVDSIWTITVYNATMYYVAKITLGSCPTNYSNVIKLTAGGCHTISCLTLGWTGSEEGYDIIQTSSGGYAVAGVITDNTTYDDNMYVANISNTGILLWSKSIGGFNQEQAHSIIQTLDGGFAVAGSTASYGPSGTNMYIVKLKVNGQIEWTRAVGNGFAYSIVQTSDSGYVAAGGTGYGQGGGDFYIVKLKSDGSLLWTKTYGGTRADQANSVIQTKDKGLAVAGFSDFIATGYDIVVVKFDSLGAIQWAKTVGGGGADQSSELVQTYDGGYAVAGVTGSFGAGSWDVYLAKLNGSGILQWTRAIGTTGNNMTGSLVQTADSGFAVSLYSDNTGHRLANVYRMDKSGNLLWGRTTSGSENQEAKSIIQTADGGYAITGLYQSNTMLSDDLYIIKLDPSGNSCCTSTIVPSVTTGGVQSNFNGTIGSGGIVGSGSISTSTGTKNVICE
jgi:hypothetical protein